MSKLLEHYKWMADRALEILELLGKYDRDNYMKYLEMIREYCSKEMKQ